jgi:intracellular sulfur oxidation DsrE/DsrF family protein
MSPRFFALAFAVGLLALAWVGFSFMGTSWLALLMTAVIAAVYLAGAYELRQFRAATTGLRSALEGLSRPPAALAEWLDRVPAALLTPVRSRIEGERGGLPGPSLAPYLVGLLVMLGMLGTFLGMVVTFKGAVFALQGSTDLQAIRAALAEPIRGLGLSFGTSVAGVASSAMLGLMSALARRERLEVARLLDSRLGTVLQPFSQVHHRKQTLRALQAQADTLPEVVTAIHAVMDRIEQRSEQLDAQLLERQAQLQREVTQAYAELARKVGASLQESLAAHTRAAGQTVQPIVEKAMARVVDDSQRLQQRLGDVAQSQADALSRQLAAAEQHRVQAWEQLTELGRTQMAALRQEEGQRGAAAVQRLSELQAAVAQHLASLGAALEAPITRMLQTAAEVPQAAAGVIGQLREEMSRVAERDNLALQERTVLLERLGTLVQSLEQDSSGQKAAIEALVGSASSVLQQTAAQVSSGASELAGLGESFGQSVRQFNTSQEKLTETMQRVEASLVKSTARSDEQLAYYVAQAREVIDLSLASQEGLIESLRQLQGKARPKALPEEARA